VARGLVVAGVAGDGSDTLAGLAARTAATLRERRVRVRDGETLLVDATLAELGAVLDERRLARALAAVGRRGDLWARLDDAWEARRGRRAVATPVRLPFEVLARRLRQHKLTRDEIAVDARWDFDAGEPTAHRSGRLVDVPELAERIVVAAREHGSGPIDVELPIRELAPDATSDVLAAIDKGEVVARYETRFAYRGKEAGRAKNVARAAAGVDGLVMMPGDVISFNRLVGPRSLRNGFARAGEIYKGEMRMGVGGGTCQVASTFHAAAYFAGLEIVERSPHSRPSGYIGIGLDATVAYPHVDLKLRNPYEFPIVVRARVDAGRMKLELLGQRRMAQVEFATSTIGVKPYTRKVREAPWLAEGRVLRKQKGIRGVTVRKVRRIRYVDGRRRVENTVDTYPPTQELYLVPPETDLDSALPPLPDGVELELDS
jgi:vancomycin resistance protein YoaR